MRSRSDVPKGTEATGPHGNAAELAMTREEVGAALGISPGRVRQIERAALAKLKRHLIARGLAYDDLAGP